MSVAHWGWAQWGLAIALVVDTLLGMYYQGKIVQKDFRVTFLGTAVLVVFLLCGGFFS